MTVIRIVMWNHSRRCSARAFMNDGTWRMSSPQPDRNVTCLTCWFAAVPCALSASNTRRFGLVWDRRGLEWERLPDRVYAS